MRVLFYPEHPEKQQYAMVALLNLLDWEGTLDPRADFDFAVAWQDVTWMQPQPLLEAIAIEKPVVNLRCLDIGKRRVEAIHREIFGRETFIDPTTFQGRCIAKADENAVGGSVIVCPIDTPDPRLVYQRIIDTAVDGCTLEYRVPVVLGEIPMVYVSRREALSGPLLRRKLSIAMVETAEVFSEEEAGQVLAFCHEIGLDMGELDVLRSHEDGLIHVLDANKTPTGYGILNRNKWRRDERRVVFRRLADTFDRRLRALLGS